MFEPNFVREPGNGLPVGRMSRRRNPTFNRRISSMSDYAFG